MANLDSRDTTLLIKVRIVKAMIFLVVMEHKQDEHQRTDAFEIVELEKILDSALDSKEIQPVSPKGNQPWIFIGRTDAEAEAPILWPPDAKSWFIGKNPDAGKGWGQEEKGVTEDEMVGWHTDSMDMSLSKLRQGVKDREAWHAAVHGVTMCWTWLSDWTELALEHRLNSCNTGA